jgi:hypothetical protein
MTLFELVNMPPITYMELDHNVIRTTTTCDGTIIRNLSDDQIIKEVQIRIPRLNNSFDNKMSNTLEIFLIELSNRGLEYEW